MPSKKLLILLKLCEFIVEPQIGMLIAPFKWLKAAFRGLRGIFHKVSSIKKEIGFTLIELLVAVGILSILAALAISQYQSYRARAYDRVALSDLKNAITAIENYYLDNQIYPDDYTELFAHGFNLSNNVCFTTFHEHDSGATVHMHILHAASSNEWHTRYPEDAGQVESRNPDSCL